MLIVKSGFVQSSFLTYFFNEPLEVLLSTVLCKFTYRIDWLVKHKLLQLAGQVLVPKRANQKDSVKIEDSGSNPISGDTAVAQDK